MATRTTPPVPRKDRSPVTQPGYRRGMAPANKGLTYPPEPLTYDEALRLIDQAPATTMGIRNRALLVLIWRTGLRISEALALRPHHIDFSDQTVLVLSGKNGKRRLVGIDLWALEEVQDWYAARADLNVEATAPLFCAVLAGSEGNPINSSYVRTLIKTYGRRAGIPKRVHPHGFRHTHACELVREGKPMNIVQRQLGHSNLGVTATYLQGIAPYEVIDAIASRPAPEREAVA